MSYFYLSLVHLYLIIRPWYLKILCATLIKLLIFFLYLFYALISQNLVRYADKIVNFLSIFILCLLVLSILWPTCCPCTIRTLLVPLSFSSIPVTEPLSFSSLFDPFCYWTSVYLLPLWSLLLLNLCLSPLSFLLLNWTAKVITNHQDVSSHQTN